VHPFFLESLPDGPVPTMISGSGLNQKQAGNSPNISRP
jgi:hypothetical protein